MEEDRMLIEAGKSLEKSISTNHEHFEKKITTLSAGTIALLMTYIATSPTPCAKWLMYVGIGFLTFSLIMNIAGYLLMEEIQYKVIEKINNRTNSPYKTYKYNFETFEANNAKINRFNIWYNKINLFIMIIGIICSIIFVFLNT